jgi:cytochrome c
MRTAVLGRGWRQCSATLGLSLLYAGAAWGQASADGLALAKSKTCLGCHQVDTKRVGPSFNAIAQRYAGQANAEKLLAAAIRQGGKGRWGAVPMPAQSQVSEQDAQRLAQWISSLRP